MVTNENCKTACGMKQMIPTSVAIKGTLLDNGNKLHKYLQIKMLAGYKKQ